MGALLLEQVGETAQRDQPAILGKQREEDTHQEAAGRFRIMAALLDAFGYYRQ